MGYSWPGEVPKPGCGFLSWSQPCVLVYDITNKTSFQNLDNWRQEFVVQASPSDPDNFPFVVLANKVDLKDQRMVSAKEGREYCSAHNILMDDQPMYYETS